MDVRCVSKLFISSQILRLASPRAATVLTVVDPEFVLCAATSTAISVAASAVTSAVTSTTISAVTSASTASSIGGNDSSACVDGVCSLSDWKPRASA